MAYLMNDQEYTHKHTNNQIFSMVPKSFTMNEKQWSTYWDIR